MAILECRRDRLVHVLDLARMYRGWTRHEVAAALGREPSKIIPESGNPKLDLVVGIARLLEWQVGEVAECLWGEPSFDEPRVADSPANGGARALALLHTARRARVEGRYQHAVERLQQALLERDLPLPIRAAVMADLAEAHYTLWHLAEARALASELLRSLARVNSGTNGSVDGERRRRHGDVPEGDSAFEDACRPAAALAIAVRGQAYRRLLRMHPEMAHRHASSARADLVAALEAIDALLTAPRVDASTAGAFACAEPSSDTLLAVAHTAHAGIVECDVELGAVTPDEGVSRLLRGLDAVIDPETMAPDAMLESWGWWSVFGANLVRAHLGGETQQRYLAIFTNKAMEIADRTGSWSLRERAFMLEHLRRGSTDCKDSERERVLLDHDDVRSIIGTMGRFPPFREAGWALLRSASIVA